MIKNSICEVRRKEFRNFDGGWSSERNSWREKVRDAGGSGHPSGWCHPYFIQITIPEFTESGNSPQLPVSFPGYC